MAEHYKGNYSDHVAYMLSIASWGWHSECGLHILRLFAAGLFDRYPKLKIIIGHDGEMLPFMLDRTLPLSKFWGERQRDLQSVWRESLWVTTSAMFSLAPFACLLRTTSVDKIMYSVDYPFVPNENGLDFIKELENSGLVTERELEMICHGNAEQLLKIKVVAE
jgi:predicted TIM-barrel fold metal-dependent hydrolase